MSHIDSVETFYRTIKELACNVHARLLDPEPEEKEGIFFECSTGKQSLVFKERKMYTVRF